MSLYLDFLTHSELVPNVYGTKLFWGWIVVDGGNEGALTNAGATGHPYWSDTLSDETHYSSVELNASKYNATYGASNKVQPRSYQLLMIIKS